MHLLVNEQYINLLRVLGSMDSMDSKHSYYCHLYYYLANKFHSCVVFDSTFTFIDITHNGDVSTQNLLYPSVLGK